MVRFSTVHSAAEISSASTLATHSRAGCPSMLSTRAGSVEPDNSEPPSSGWSSIRMTRAPERTASRAAARPAGPPPTTRTSVWTYFLSYSAWSSAGSSLPSPLSSSALRPSTRDTVVAGSMDSATWPGNRAATLTRALDSSTPADMMPRGRPSYRESPARSRPLASRAEARVSPGWPVYSRPSRVKRHVTLRSMRPPVLRRAGCG